MGSFKVAVKKPPPFTVSNWLLTNCSLEVIVISIKNLWLLVWNKRIAGKKQNKKPLQALSLSSTKHVPVESNRKMGSTLLRKQNSLYLFCKTEERRWWEGRGEIWQPGPLMVILRPLRNMLKGILIIYFIQEYLYRFTQMVMLQNQYSEENPLFRSLSLILSRTEGKSLQRL